MDDKVAELEKRVDRLEKAFKFYLNSQKKSLNFLRKAIDAFKRVIGI